MRKLDTIDISDRVNEGMMTGNGLGKEGVLFSSKKQIILTGWKKRTRYLRNNFSDLIVIFKKYKSPLKAIKGLLKVFLLFRKVPRVMYTKMAKVDGDFWRVHYIPGWGNKIHNKYLLSQMGKMVPHSDTVSRLLNVYFAVTKRCTYQCEHCFEADTLNEKEELSANELNSIMKELSRVGTYAVHFTGGEPMQRLDDLLPIIQEHKDNMIFWMLTSGYAFNEKNAKALKVAGLTGVVVSLDHYDRIKHDKFRGVAGAFDNALKAIKNAIEQDLVCVLTLCINNKNANQDFLMRMMKLAKELGVAFVQILEAEALGAYKGQDVKLNDIQAEMVENFYLEMNKKKQYKEFPIVVYHGYYQRRVGCLSSGRNSLYIDAEGGVRSCPFCKSYAGNVLEENIDVLADVLSERGCSKFKNVPF